jgi:glycosyltransferase involved in cell wall biosynthesis
MIEALKVDCDVTLFTRDAPDFDAANRAFGTTLNDREVRVLRADVSGGWVARRLKPVAHLGLLRDHRLLTEARRLAPEFDVVVTANNESDLGRPGVQYVHFPKFVIDRPDPGLGWYQTPRAVSLYQRVCNVATGFRLSRARANVTLANSAWTAHLLREQHGLTAEVLHPPIAGPFETVPWQARERAVVCVGRVAPEKRLEEAMAIVARVREGRPDVTMRILGHADDRAYAARVESAARARGDWVRVELDLPRAELLSRIAHCRIGLHAMQDEHFGMAVAELLRAGAVPFAHASGGPVEILGGDRRLLFDDEADAAAKIGRVLDDEDLASAVRKELASRAEGFSVERFVAGFRAAVGRCLPEGSA